jgi:hypothetical protein
MTRRRLFLLFFLAAAACLVWPVYPWAAARLPALLGLPGFFAWPVVVLAAVFVALVVLYRAEGAERERGGRGGRGGRAGGDG